MKLLKYGFYLLAIAASAVSCTRKDGDWDPIKTDCREITVPPQGGSAVVTMKKLQRLVDFHVQYEAKGENLMIHGEDFGFMKFENEWCEIVVPSESPNKLYIALKENDGREPRKIGIGMTVGDAFTSIDITQGSALLTTPNE
jgi:hypothetical protein